MRKIVRVSCFFLLAATLFVACKKKNDKPEYTRRDYLLGTWSRVLRAYDVNSNHTLDSSENFYGPGTDTFLLSLLNDATFKRTQVFKGVNFTDNGTWHLQDNDDNIVLQPTTSTSEIDTFRFDTVSQAYFRFHKLIRNSDTWYWEDYVRP